MIEHQPVNSDELDMRSKLIGQIWRMMPAILGISIPLEAVTNAHGAIAITALLAAGLSTVTIWLTGAKTGAPARLKVDDSANQGRLQELEERLANLESITNFEHKLLEAKYPNAAPMPVERPVMQNS